MTRSDLLIAINARMYDLYASAGVPREKLRLIHNFVEAPSDIQVDAPGDYWVFAGRLSPEKGVKELVENWPSDKRLLIAGDGPLAPWLRNRQSASVGLVGQLPRSQLLEVLSRAVGLVFPSRWLEGSPLVCLEALSVGCPILTTPENAVADTVSSLGVGAVATGDLSASLAAAEDSFSSLRAHCRQVFQEMFSPEAWLKNQLGVYLEAVERGRRR